MPQSCSQFLGQYLAVGSTLALDFKSLDALTPSQLVQRALTSNLRRRSVGPDEGRRMELEHHILDRTGLWVAEIAEVARD